MGTVERAGPRQPVGPKLKRAREDLNWEVARAFFGVAILIVAVDSLWLGRDGGLPNYLAVMSLCLGILGLGMLPLSRQTYNRPTIHLRLPNASTWSFLAILVAFLAFYSVTGSLEATGFNEPVRQSDAFLHGRIWVENVPQYMEHITWKGRTYLVHPPMSAILLMPAVMLFGMSTNQTAISVILGAIEVALAWRLLGLLRLSMTPRIWLTVFFGIGTTLWYEATVGNSWDFVLIVSVLMTLLALNELFGLCRAWLLGLLTAFAALTRYDLALTFPLYALALMVLKKKPRELAWMLPGWIFAALVFVILNEIRFGTVFDLTMWIFYPTDPQHHPDAGPLSLAYVPANLYTLLFLAPVLDGRFPYIHPTLVGQSLPLTSPAFVLALRPRFCRPLPCLIALMAAVGSLLSITFYASGFAQFGTRYYLQVYPFLLVLMALGMKHKVDQLAKVLIVTSIVLVSFGIWQIRGLGF